MSGDEKSTQLPRRTFHSWQFYLNQFALREQRKRRSHVRRPRGHSRTGLIAVEAGRSLWLLGDPKRTTWTPIPR